MPFDEGVAERVRELLEERDDVVEKKMFGGLAFMISGNMCIGVVRDQLMLRVGTEHYQQYLKEKHVSEMDFTGRPLKGFLYLKPEGFAEDGDLKCWLTRALSFVDTLPAK